MLAVRVETDSTFSTRTPEVLFEIGYALDFANGFPNYDVSPDGQQFVMVTRASEGGESAEIIVVQNWFEELTRLVPVD